VRILVVDDRIQSRWAIADWLSALVRSVSIESAASAPEALAAIAKRKPNVVLAAHPMRDMGGIGLARHLKSRGDPPLVVVMTERQRCPVRVGVRRRGRRLLARETPVGCPAARLSAAAVQPLKLRQRPFLY
jgi:CheY-like chemotaxis protein